MTSDSVLIFNEYKLYISFFEISTSAADGVRNLNFLTGGEGVAYAGLPFPATGCPVPNVCIYCVPA